MYVFDNDTLSLFLIAAKALVNGCAVVTCNLSHFEPIPDLRVVDWSQ